MGRLIWRCRRGTRELDIILGGFLDAGYHRLDERQRELFERLLDCEDDRLQAWLVTATEAVDPKHVEIVELIRRSD